MTSVTSSSATNLLLVFADRLESSELEGTVNDLCVGYSDQLFSSRLRETIAVITWNKTW
jgi:hypothetical protein